MDSNASAALTEAALSVTELGSFLVIAVMGLFVSAFLWIHGQRRAVVLLWLALVGVYFLNDLLKWLFARERPDVFQWRTVGAGGNSFPSGHAMNAMVAYTVFAYLIARLESTAALRRTTFAVAALVILLVGLSRMYLGVHYPTDVLAGFAAGFAWAMACVFAVYVLADIRGA
jgi:undecaprenyl-diphosphatase